MHSFRILLGIDNDIAFINTGILAGRILIEAVSYNT